MPSPLMRDTYTFPLEVRGKVREGGAVCFTLKQSHAAFGSFAPWWPILGVAWCSLLGMEAKFTTNISVGLIFVSNPGLEKCGLEFF